MGTETRQEAVRRTRRFGGRRALLVLLLVWLAVLAVVYVYVVRLKMKGEKGLREEALPSSFTLPSN